MPLRIEFMERFVDLTPEEMAKYDTMNTPYPKDCYSYRRVSMKLADVFGVKEMPRWKAHCIIEFYPEVDREDMTVKGSYDTVLQFLEDRAKMEEEGDGYEKPSHPPD
jgi:hypothetical protein